MAFSKPIGYIPGSAVRRGPTEKQFEKMEKMRDDFYKFLESQIENFVRLAHEKAMGGAAGSAERLTRDRKSAQEIAERVESLKSSAESMGDEEGELSEAITLAMKNVAAQSDEEFIKESGELDKEAIDDTTAYCLNMIWQMALRTIEGLWEENGPQSIGVKKFLAKFDFAAHLGLYISDEHFSKIKTLLAEFLPLVLRDSYMMDIERKSVETVYLESSGQIVLREVSWEMLQTWANS